MINRDPSSQQSPGKHYTQHFSNLTLQGMNSHAYPKVHECCTEHDGEVRNPHDGARSRRERGFGSQTNIES